MSLRFRILLAMAGLTLVCFSCAIGIYLSWPMENQHAQDLVAPTLFAPPR